MKTQIEITETNRQALASTLSTSLADENQLYIKTKNAHRNIKRADVYDRHEFFKSHLQRLDEMIDNISERLSPVGL